MTEALAQPPTNGLAKLLATWFGCGLSPIAPGTAGTLGALPLYFALRGVGLWAVPAAALVLCAVGIWASSTLAREMDVKDPQIIVIDEVVGVLIALSVAHPTWGAVALAVVLFRFFDMTKVAPARWAERNLPGGWGIVLDDVVAGCWAAFVVVVLQRFDVV